MWRSLFALVASCTVFSSGAGILLTGMMICGVRMMMSTRMGDDSSLLFSVERLAKKAHAENNYTEPLSMLWCYYKYNDSPRADQLMKASALPGTASCTTQTTILLLLKQQPLLLLQLLLLPLLCTPFMLNLNLQQGCTFGRIHVFSHMPCGIYC